MPNALQHETSPYLLQHADNPVDWLPWGPEALDKARELDKPILLSIGYSACHWCHVMAHESFEDEDTAAVMNELFVNIKVDREERPDLDRIYQLSQQLLTGRAGGWPLTVFLTPEEQWPFFAGTYFPKSTSHGLPSFVTVLQQIAAYFGTNRDEIGRNTRRLHDALERTVSATAPGQHQASGDFSDAARERLGEAFDAANGGFGNAPKFPHATEIDWLLRRGTDDPGAREMAVSSLRAMVSGGLFDHLGGGFFRYCVDDDWCIPHFEKMLYDNAALLGSCAEAYAATGDTLLRGAANATADWLFARMQNDRGAFYATLDADSEGEEGKYYTFTREDLETVLATDEVKAASTYFGLDEPKNFEDRSWHLQPRQHAVAFDALVPVLNSARLKLHSHRRQRTPPDRDDKILTSWNGLMMIGLARAARHLQRPELGLQAQRIANFIHSELWREGRLLATYKDRQARLPAYLDDYALTAWGLLELLQWRFRATDLEFAISLADTLLEHFAAPDGGFFFTADDHETLIHRPKPLADESLPSGNGAAALVLDTLGHLLGEPHYLQAAGRTVQAALSGIARVPEAHATLLTALERTLEPPELIIVRGRDPELSRWQQRIAAEYQPHRLLFCIDSEEQALPGVLQSRVAADITVAYRCRGTTCEAPTDSLDDLLARLAPAD